MKERKNPLLMVLLTEWNHLGDKKKRFILYLILFTIAGIISLMSPLVIGLIFNSIQQSISSDLELKKLILKIFLLLAITIGFWAFHGVGRVLEELTGFQVNKNYVNSKLKRILELPVRWHKDNHSGDTIDKINRGGTAILNFSQSTTYDVVYAIVNIFGSIIILFFIDYKIAIFALVFSIITLFVIARIDKHLIKYYRKLNKFSNRVSAAIFDYLSNIITVITLHLKKIVSREVDLRLEASYRTMRKAAIINEIKWGATSIAISTMTVLALAFRAYTDYHATGIILIGTLYMLYGYLRAVGDTFYRFASLYGRIVKYGANLSNVNPIDEEYKKIEESISEQLPLGWREIELKDVNFKYNKEGNERHLEKVNVTFTRGQKIAFIGESGSGKSTILSLMRGLHNPDSGEVICNGIPIKNGFNKLKPHITLIPQDPEIFNNTIRYNITMDVRTKEEDLERSISIAQFKKVIQRLEKGLETNVLEKGVSLSGGEKQRLALARGILAARKSDIILLDEPTSSVDSLNEMKIHDELFKEFKDKTIISSIHRLHLLSKFDQIYMFEKGKVIASGTLQELKKNPKFNFLWKKYHSEKVKK